MSKEENKHYWLEIGEKCSMLDMMEPDREITEEEFKQIVDKHPDEEIKVVDLFGGAKETVFHYVPKKQAVQILSSKNIVGKVHDRFRELEEKGWDWVSFYNGWIEGRMEMAVSIGEVTRIKGSRRCSEDCLCNECA